jgi:hypothetical protein
MANGSLRGLFWRVVDHPLRSRRESVANLTSSRTDAGRIVDVRWLSRPQLGSSQSVKQIAASGYRVITPTPHLSVPVSNAYQNAQRLALPSSIPNCGSSVFWEGDRSPTTCGIAVRCFADPDFPVPTSSGWEELMHRWVGLPPGAARFPQSRS